MSLNLLCIDDDRDFLLHLQLQLESLHKVIMASDMSEGMQILGKGQIDAVLLDIGLDGVDGLAGLSLIKKKYPKLPVIMLTAYKDIKTVVKAIQEGASNYICKPFETEELAAILNKIEEAVLLREHNQALIATLNNNYVDIPMVGKSWRFRQIIEQAMMVKGHKANILIQGESGTGKELLALFLRNLEENPKRPYIAVNCAAIPVNLIESELFGHERGSFTGAVSRKIGKFELANGGDIFLDEISSLPLDLQTKILRVLQEKTFCRVGGNVQIHSDFRVIAAANTDLEEMIKQKTFRMDLFHRLRVVHLQIPPLRERKEDIPELIEIFLDKYCRGRKKQIMPEAVDKLVAYDWPGNIRELENVVQSLVIMNLNDEITKNNLPPWLTDGYKNETSNEGGGYLDLDGLENYSHKEFVRMAEKRFIGHILNKNNGNRQKTAEELGMARSTFYVKLRELALI